MKGKGQIHLQRAGTGPKVLMNKVDHLEYPTQIDTNKLAPGFVHFTVNSDDGTKAITVMKE